MSEAFENIPDEHRYSLELHKALVKIAGLVVIPFEQQLISCEYSIQSINTVHTIDAIAYRNTVRLRAR